MPTLALVDDDENILASLKVFFEGEGYTVRTYTDGATALAALSETPPDLAILDIKMPRMDGVEVLRRLRQGSNLPVIFLTSKDDEMDEVVGFNVGADDYITKPFSPRELVSRIKAVLRRTEGTSGSMHGLIEIDKRLKIDFERREIWLEGKLVKLRPTEYRLLYHLVQNAGWVVSHDQLLQKVWGYEYRDEPHYVRLYINYLRQKLEKDPANPVYILTERGVGYRFVDFKRNKE